MRTHWAALAVSTLLPLLALPSCGDSGSADSLFGPSPGATSGGSGGASEDAATGGTGGSSGSSGTGATGGTGGSGQTGGYGGTTQTGGYGGTEPMGGYGGTEPMGGYGGTEPMGGYGGTGQTGGFGGTPQTGGTGGGPPPLGTVPCPTANPSDANECVVPGQACCLTFANNQSGACIDGTQAGGCETDIQCDAPADCPQGQACCGHLISWNNTWRYDGVRCQTSCGDAEDVVFCDPYDNAISCGFGESCGPSSILPDGYYVCQ